MQDAVTETDHLGAPGTTHLSSHRRQRALELPPVEDGETRQLQEAMVLSLQEERRQEEERKRMRDAALVERLMLSELTQREATEAEARRVATEAVVAQAWRRQVCEQIDESRADWWPLNYSCCEPRRHSTKLQRSLGYAEPH